MSKLTQASLLFFRFDPKNSHQRPVVVILCGTGFQAAIGINCARHLANRLVKVVLFLSKSFPLSVDAESELQLYQLTNGKVTSESAGFFTVFFKF